jgi:hypothetical protein
MYAKERWSNSNSPNFSLEIEIHIYFRQGV